MPKFVSKPVEVEAHQIKSMDQLWQAPLGGINRFFKKGELGAGRAVALGGHTPKVGDYVIFLSRLDVYLCPKEVFESKYEALACKGILLGDDKYSGCSGTHGDCPECGK